jgi:hypothetical protein
MANEKKNLKMKNKIFLFGIILFSILFLNYVSAYPLSCSDNPVALWHFNEGSGNITTDSCSGITGYILGSNITWINGKYGKSILFNGIDNYVNVGNKLNQSFDNFSIYAWVKANLPSADYQTFVGREINYQGTYFWNFALAKDSVNQGYPESSYFNLFDNGNQNVVGTYFTPQYDTISDGSWHLLVGTFEGATQNMSLYYDGNIVTSAIATNSNILSSTDYFLMGSAFNSDISNFAYFLNGSLDDVAVFNKVLTPTEIANFYNPTPQNFTCYSNANKHLNVPTYPYVKLNSVYPIDYQVSLNNSLIYNGDFNIDITELDGNISTFGLPFDYNAYSYNNALLFNTAGNYPFTIYSTSSCISNFSGTLLVRQSYNITICGFKQSKLCLICPSSTSSYVNDFSYLIAENTNKNTIPLVEQFLVPLGFATTFNTSVFYTTYRSGCGTLDLFDTGEYNLRIFDGQATFPLTYSVPNISQTYGTNIYLGKYTFNGTDTSYNVLFSDRDMHPFNWLFNLGIIIFIIAVFILSIVLFFVFPEKPFISIIGGLGFIAMAILIKIVVWIWWGI